MLPARDRPSAASKQASYFAADHVLQHRLVQAEIGHQLLQLAVLLLELTKPLHLRRRQPAVLVPPVVERRLADPGLAAHLRYRRALLSLPQDEGDLALAELRLLHRKILRPARVAKLESSSSKWSKIPGAGHYRDRLYLLLDEFSGLRSHSHYRNVLQGSEMNNHRIRRRPFDNTLLTPGTKNTRHAFAANTRNGCQYLMR
jgi:hypothetical protein